MPITNQFAAVTGRPSGIDYESLVRAKAKLLPTLYAQKELETERARELATSTDQFNKNLSLANANLDLIKSKNQSDIQTAQDALAQGKTNAAIGTTLGVGGLGVTGYKAYKDMQLTDKLDKILNPGSEQNIIPGQGGELVNTTNMNPDAAIERVSSVPNSEVITNLSPKTVPGTETITPQFNTLPSGDIGAGISDTGTTISSELFDTGLEDLFASPTTSMSSSPLTSSTPIGGFETSMFNELPAVNTAPVASWFNTAPSVAEAGAIAPEIAQMAGEYGAQGGIGTGIGELSSTLSPALEAGPFFAAMYGANELMNKAILPGITRAVFGPDRFLQEIPTEEIVSNYNKGDWGAGGVAPVWNELVRRGATLGLTPPSEKDMADSYINKADMGSWGWA